MGQPWYVATTIDECTDFSMVRFICRAYETHSPVIEMIREMENFSNLKTKTSISLGRNIVKLMRSHGGGE